MQDIGALLERTKEENQCSVLYALLILLDAQKKEERNVHILQPESE